MTRIYRGAQPVLASARTLALFALLWAVFTFVQAQPAVAGGAVTDENVAEHVASAQTAADHEALATYFRSEAAAAGEKAKMHEAMMNSRAQKMAGKSWPSWEMHCKSLISTYKAAQKEAEALASEHERMAKDAGK